MSVQVISPGVMTTVQDLGRFGFAHLGVTPSGAADSLAFRMANYAAGNESNAPALEMTLSGATLQFTEPAIIAIGGSRVSGGSQHLPSYEPLEVGAGFVLHGGPILDGARAYVAIRGGFRVSRVMGSGSTHVAAGFGGHQGRPLRARDVLERDTLPHTSPRSLGPQLRQLLRSNGTIRVTPGPQADWFSAETIQCFLSSDFEVTEQSDRSGLRLFGPEIRPSSRPELLTEGVALGAIQVPHNAQPIILFVDQQTTGGYPKIATVARVDMHHIGQLRPRDTLRFHLIPFESAIALYREQERIISEAFAS